MAPYNKMAREQQVKQKSQTIFYIYYQMGVGRTLMKLADIMGQVGVRASLHTLERYSVKFEWQRQILEMDNKVQEAREVQVLKEVESMNARHAMIGQALTSIAGNELQKFIEKRKNTKRPLGVYEITQLFKSGQFGERLARGQATSRTDVMVEVISLFVKEFAEIFLAVNEITDPMQRQLEYVRRCDEMIREVNPQAQAGTLRLGRG